jgi:hypothetical protein
VLGGGLVPYSLILSGLNHIELGIFAELSVFITVLRSIVSFVLDRLHL